MTTQSKHRRPLTRYRITYDDGSTCTTSMAAHITLADARAYYVGQTFTEEDPETGRETRRKAARVEQLCGPEGVTQ